MYIIHTQCVRNDTAFTHRTCHGKSLRIGLIASMFSKNVPSFGTRFSHVARGFRRQEYIAEYRSMSSRIVLSILADTRRKRIYSLHEKGGTTTTLRDARSHGDCDTARATERCEQLPRREYEARRQVTGRQTERSRHVRRRRGFGRTRTRSATLGRLRRAVVGRAVYP